MSVHPTAVVASGATLAASVEVGPFSVIGAQVVLGAGCRIGAHAVVEGDTTLGEGCEVGHHAVLGGLAQYRQDNRPGTLRLGRHNRVRELATINAGAEGRCTKLGDDNLLMAYTHVGHDCQLGSGNELANGVQLAGHVELGDHVTVGGLAALHQYVRVGDHAMIGGGAMVAQDVPPFCQASGDRARVYGINVVGLRRAGFDGQARENIAQAVQLLFGASTLQVGIEQVRARYGDSAAVENLLTFAEGGQRGLCRLVW